MSPTTRVAGELRCFGIAKDFKAEQNTELRPRFCLWNTTCVSLPEGKCNFNKVPCVVADTDENLGHFGDHENSKKLPKRWEASLNARPCCLQAVVEGPATRQPLTSAIFH